MSLHSKIIKDCLSGSFGMSECIPFDVPLSEVFKKMLVFFGFWSEGFVEERGDNRNCFLFSFQSESAFAFDIFFNEMMVFFVKLSFFNVKLEKYFVKFVF